MYQEELNSSNLAKFLNEFDYVFVDTCSLMEDSFPLFMDRLASSKEYWREGLQVIVLGECIEELKKHAKEKKKEKNNSRIAAARAIKIIRHDKWHNKAITITKAEGEAFADNAIFTKVSSLRIHNKILVITQDKTLTTDLLKLNQLDSQKGRYLSVYRITNESNLEKNPGETFKKEFNKKHDASSFKQEEKDKKRKPLTKAQLTIIKEDDKLVKNLNNPNYKLKNKLTDIDLQLKRLKDIDQKLLSEIVLKLNQSALLEKRNELSLNMKKPDKKERNDSKKLTKETIYSGKTASIALKALAASTHSIIRDPSVYYIESVHGPFDLTNDDLTNVDILSSKKDNLSYVKGKKTFLFVKKNNEFVVSLKKEEQKPEVKKQEEAKKPVEAKKKTDASRKKEKIPSKTDESLSKKKVKIVKVKGVNKDGSSSAIPEGIVLVVGEPKNNAPKAKSDSKKETKIAVLKKPSKKISLETIINEDRVLNANINNPNYPKDKALEDIKKQKDRLKNVSGADMKKLNLNLNDLAKIEKKLKTSSK